jgi:hypothetical protein
MRRRRATRRAHRAAIPSFSATTVSSDLPERLIDNRLHCTGRPMTTLAKFRLGRVALHVLCMLRGSDARMHLAGVAREFLRAA